MVWLATRLGWALPHWFRQNIAFIGYYLIPGYAALRSRSVLESFSAHLSAFRLALGFVCWTGQFLLLDFLYETTANLLKRDCRPLSPREIETGKQVFGDTIRWDLVMVDEKAGTTRRKDAVRAYVSFNTINYDGTPDDETLIHELIHIWQYQRFGAVYIAKALAAQKTAEGYDYTRYENWRSAGSLLDFNAEQQGEIAVDYYRTLNGFAPCYRRATRDDFPFFEKWIKSIK